MWAVRCQRGPFFAGSGFGRTAVDEEQDERPSLWPRFPPVFSFLSSFAPACASGIAPCLPTPPTSPPRPVRARREICRVRGHSASKKSSLGGERPHSVPSPFQPFIRPFEGFAPCPPTSPTSPPRPVRACREICRVRGQSASRKSSYWGESPHSEAPSFKPIHPSFLDHHHT